GRRHSLRTAELAGLARPEQVIARVRADDVSLLPAALPRVHHVAAPTEPGRYVAARVPVTGCVPVLDLDQQHRPEPFDGGLAPFDSLQLSAFDIDFDEIEAGQLRRSADSIERLDLDVHADLAAELGIGTLPGAVGVQERPACHRSVPAHWHAHDAASWFDA